MRDYYHIITLVLNQPRNCNFTPLTRHMGLLFIYFTTKQLGFTLWQRCTGIFISYSVFALDLIIHITTSGKSISITVRGNTNMETKP